MKNSSKKIYAFIDSQNLNLEIQRLEWKIDFKRFFIYLKDKYKIQKAFLFIGYISKYKKLYNFLEKCGYNLIFKETVKDKNGKTKGNVDAELVLHCAKIEYENYDQAIIVTNDGDFKCLVQYLLENNKFLILLAPNIKKCSTLLKKILFNKEYISFLNKLKFKLELKNPDQNRDF